MRVLKAGLKHLLPKNANLYSYQLISKGARFSESAILGDLDLKDGSLLHLTPAPDSGILLHLQNDHGGYFDARVKPSMTVKGRKSSLSIYPLWSEPTADTFALSENFLSIFFTHSSSWSNKREAILFLIKFFASQKSNSKTMLPSPLTN